MHGGAGPAAMLLTRYSAGSPGAFTEYRSVAELCDGICEQYERGLKLCLAAEPGTTKRHIAYGLNELLEYLEAADSMRVLLRKSGLHAGDLPVWIEQDKDWIKRTLVSHLKQQSLNNTIAFSFCVHIRILLISS